ncbi:MAG: ROK family protein [Chloroflexota bacterium]
MDNKFCIGVDIGGTKISFVLINRAGDVLASHRLPTNADDGEETVFKQVATGIQHLQVSTDKSIEGIGVGCPGRLNPHTGIVYKATNMYWENVNLREGIAQNLQHKCPIYIHQDANAQAVGEYFYGVAKDVSNFVMMTIGTGFGGAAILDGQLVIGHSFNSMEIGHMPLDVNGRLCVCGMRGCPEMYISGVGLQAGAQELLPQFPDSQLHQVTPLTTPTILDAFHQGDALAIQLIDEMNDWLSTMCIICMSMLNPSLFVIGGGLGDALFDVIQQHLPQKLAHLNREIHVPVPIKQSQLADSAIGAAALVWHHTENH